MFLCRRPQQRQLLSARAYADRERERERERLQHFDLRRRVCECATYLRRGPKEPEEKSRIKKNNNNIQVSDNDDAQWSAQPQNATYTHDRASYVIVSEVQANQQRI